MSARPPTIPHVLEDSTETLVVYPPILAQATVATIRIATTNSALPAVGESATVDPVSTTLSSAALRGARSIAVASATFVRGRRYVLTDATTGRRIIVTAAKGGTLTTLPLEGSLTMDVATGSTLVGFAISKALTADQTATTGPGVAEVTATIDGVEERWAADFRVVPRSGVYMLTGDDLVQTSPYSRNRLPDDDDDGSQAIHAAWVRYLEPALLVNKVRPERIVSWGVFNPVHVAAVEHHLAQTYEDDQQIRAEKKAAFVEALSQAMNNLDTWVTPGDDLSQPDPEKRTFWDTSDVWR